MHTDCPNCNETTSPLIDVRTLKNKRVDNDTQALCEHCLKPIPLTIFAIKSLYSMKRYYDPKPQKAFQYMCESCNKYQDAKISADRSEALCIECDSKFDLTPFMLTALRIQLGVQRDNSSKKLNQVMGELQKKQEELKQEAKNESTQESSDSDDLIVID